MEPQFLYFVLITTFFLAPVVIGAYVWQCSGYINVLQNFEQTNVIQKESAKENGYVESYSDFLIKFQKVIDRKIWSIIAVIVTIGLLILLLLVIFPLQFNVAGRSAFWYDIKWFLVVFLLIFAGGTYFASVAVLKQIPAIFYFNRLFQWFDVRIRPMHSDEAGGLGALGNFTLKTSLFCVGFGAIAATLSILELSYGTSTRPDLLLLWVVYILITPMSLILPMLSAHRAMQEARNEKLNKIAQEFEKTLSDFNVAEIEDVKAIKDVNERLQELQTQYSIIADSYPTWPVPARLFRNFSITASLPLVSGLISMGINYSTQQ